MPQTLATAGDSSGQLAAPGAMPPPGIQGPGKPGEPADGTSALSPAIAADDSRIFMPSIILQYPAQLKCIVNMRNQMRIHAIFPESECRL